MSQLTAADLAAESTSDLARAERVLPVAMRMVEDYAAGAPAELKNEAAIRFGAYLLQSPSAGAVRSDSAAEFRTEYVVNHAAAFRNSGAAMLLTRYRVRRAGAIG